jgi:succinyl-CoA synthetase beta subunit
MARLHEYQGKALLQQHQILVPRGGPASTPGQARDLAATLAGPVVVKAQAWVTGRASLGAIRFADTPEQAEAAAAALLGQRLKGLVVETVLVEEKLAIQREFYAGLIIDDARQTPVVIFSAQGGSGVEEISQRAPQAIATLAVDVGLGLRDFEARDLVRRTGLHGELQARLGALLSLLYQAAASVEARAAEINPIVETADGRLVAADCRITVDDYAVYRHPELGIEVAREFDRPPTPLEKIAWEIEKNDYRGTFYFVQMEQDFERGQGVIGFHGAGGGGSMMSMDAVLNRGYKLANFVDTSGNPPASKVYRAAKIILSQPGLDGYFASGSGVASQEQFHSARGLAKAFLEEPLSMPAVIRLGGNAEERAISILENLKAELAAPVEAYGKAAPPDACAERLQVLVEGFSPPAEPGPSKLPPQPAVEPYVFETVTGGTITYDHALCRDCASKICIETCVPQILSLDAERGGPVLNISLAEAKRGKCIECLACEVECYFHGNRGGRITLPIAGLEAYRQAQA